MPQDLSRKGGGTAEAKERSLGFNAEKKRDRDWEGEEPRLRELEGITARGLAARGGSRESLVNITERKVGKSKEVDWERKTQMED